MATRTESRPGLQLLELCSSARIEEVSVYCFTQDNTRRASAQTAKFRTATVEFAFEIQQRGAALLVLGDDRSALFPDELRPFRRRTGKGIRVNLLVNYGWEWDLDGIKNGGLRSSDVARLDLIVRWGGVDDLAASCRFSRYMRTSTSSMSFGRNLCPTTFDARSRGSLSKIARSGDSSA